MVSDLNSSSNGLKKSARALIPNLLSFIQHSKKVSGEKELNRAKEKFRESYDMRSQITKKKKQ